MCCVTPTHLYMKGASWWGSQCTAQPAPGPVSCICFTQISL